MRDLDILGPMGRKGLAQVCLSVTTLDRGFARKMEPRCPTPARRLEAIRALSDAGVQTGVMAAPMIPVLNDPELESILEAACGAGATIAGYVLLRLPLEIKDLFREWLEAHVPMKADHVLNAVRLLQQRFEKACKRLGLNERRYKLRTDLFRPPLRRSDQAGLFD
jgi:DNA repair photolyase